MLQGIQGPLGQQMMGQINAVNFFRGIFKEFEIPNLNEIFQQNPALMGMVPQGMQPGQVPTSGQVATQMTPESLAQMGQQPLTGPPAQSMPGGMTNMAGTPGAVLSAA